jgi:hypothetical protein
MAEVSHGTGDETLGDGGLEELCVLLKASDIVVEGLRFFCPDENRSHRHRVTVDFRSGRQNRLYIPFGPEVEYTDLMQAIGECTNLNKLSIWQKISLCDDLLCVQLCKALCKNHSVSDLLIDLIVDGSQDCQPNFDIFLNQIVVMLESNVGLKLFTFQFHSLHAPTFWCSDGFANALERNRTLEVFRMCFSDLPSDLQRLVQPLIADGSGQQKNSTLIKLSLEVMERYEREDEESLTVAANVLAKMLQNNSSLKQLSLWAPRYSVDSFAEALETNHILEHLDLRGNLLNLQRLLQPLTVDANGQQSNTTLLQLQLQLHINPVQQDDMQPIVDSLAKMLQNNSSLKELNLSQNRNFTESDVCALIKSLENNNSLEVLDLSYCAGVRKLWIPCVQQDDMQPIVDSLPKCCKTTHH